jgi:hypothetical protein
MIGTSLRSPNPWPVRRGEASKQFAPLPTQITSPLSGPGETEAGSAGTQPCRGITRWAHRVDEMGSVEVRLKRSLPTPTQRPLIER